MTNDNNKPSITRPFVSWYCQGVYIIDHSRKGSVQVCRFLEEDIDEAEKVWLCNVYTAVPFRGRGIATRCIRAAIHYCQKHNIGALYLWCKKEMFGFYERFGFELAHHFRMNANGDPVYTMVCTIPPAPKPTPKQKL